MNQEEGSLTTGWRQMLFPAKARQFRGQRWFDIGLRSIHLVGIVGLGGGFLFHLPSEQYELFWLVTLLSGGLLMLINVWSSAVWLFQVKGQAILLKLVMLYLAGILPEWDSLLFILIILLSGVVAHAPGKIRGFCLFSSNQRNICS